MTVKAFWRFLTSDPPGHSADGRSIGIGLSAALKKYYSADDAERHLDQWSAEHELRKSQRH